MVRELLVGISEAIETMSIRILCPNLKCRAILTVPDDTRGKKVGCGHCSSVLMVPKVQTTVKAPATAEAQSADDKQ